jgi:hypothetical protein
MRYEEWASGAFSGVHKSPNTWPATSFEPSTRWGAAIVEAMTHVEVNYAAELMRQMLDEQVAGEIVEFGVFEGAWMQRLIEIKDAFGMTDRRVIGFDSFEGLPELRKEDAGMGWSKGQFAASYDDVALRLGVGRRTDVALVKGWFNATLQQRPATDVARIAYARVDGDLYRSAVDALNYLKGRLSHRSILVFDDWTFDLEKGETKAFAEWAPTSGYRFDCLGFFSIGRLYLRVSSRESSTTRTR